MPVARAPRRGAALRSHKITEAGCELWEVAQTRTTRLRCAHRSWSWHLRATRPWTLALVGMIRSGPLTSCSLAPRLRGGRCPDSPTTALASTCRSPPSPGRCSVLLPPPRSRIRARLPACHTVAPRLPHVRPCPRPRQRWSPRPRAHTGPRLWCPGRVRWLQQHPNPNLEWHQHGGAACLRRRRPAARCGLDPLGGAG